MKNILFIFACLLFVNCASTKAVKTTESTTPSETNDLIVAKAKVGEFAKVNDPLKIENVTMQGNLMLIEVTYGGGCKDHNFELIGSPAIAKSFPPQRGIQLVHKSNNDMCRALIKKTISIDVTDLIDNKQEGAQIYYNLEGYEGRILHTYKEK